MFFGLLGCLMLFSFIASGNKDKSKDGDFLTKLIGEKKRKELDENGYLSLFKKNKTDEDDEDEKKEEEDSKESDKESESNNDEVSLKDKSLYLMQQEMDKYKDEDTPEAKEMRESYNDYMSCAYDENGEERSPEDMQKMLEALPPERLEKIKNATGNVSDESLNSIKNAKVTPQDVQAAKERAIGDRINIEKSKKEAELLQEKTDKLNSMTNATDEEKSAVEKEYQDKIDASNKEFDEKIKAARTKLKDIQTNQQGVEDEKKNKEIEELNKKKENLEKIVNGDEEAINGEIKKCQELKAPAEIQNFDNAVTDKNDPNHDKAIQHLKDQGIDPETYAAAKEAGQDETKLNKLKEDIKTKSSKELENVNNEIQKKSNPETKTVGEPKKEPEEDKEEVIQHLDDDGDPDGSFVIKKQKDADGNTKYVMRDKDGEEVEISKEEFEKEKSKASELEDEKNEEGEDDEDIEATDDDKDTEEKDGKKVVVNPAKVWHKKKNKSTGKSTKSYYNKNGDSISDDEFKEKMNAYKERKSKATKESLSYYFKNMIVENKEQKHELSDFLKGYFK